MTKADVECPECGASFVAPWSASAQGSNALYRFCLRLLSEGYVKPSRAAELKERATNARERNGFLTDAEYTAKQLRQFE